MSFGICLFSCIPAKKEASHSSEMVTQLLFGERYKVLKQEGDWLQIITISDNYTCFIHHKQHQALADKEQAELEKHTQVYVKDIVQTVFSKSENIHFPVTIGSQLPHFNNGDFSIGQNVYHYDGHLAFSNEKKTAKELLDTAFLFLHAPYLWGGRSPFGLDCSGFTQLVFKLNGYTLPRDAYQQVELGKPLSFVEEAEAGDLAFFDNEDGRIVHVGLLLSNKEIIHASGSVRIDPFDHYGIFNRQQNKGYSHTLRVIKRLL
ncbi:MAG: C40 family peptidase [Bacteroidia bacterium]|nr:C40 family peptidase [Bacteroidia bacterium]